LEIALLSSAILDGYLLCTLMYDGFAITVVFVKMLHVEYDNDDV